MIISHPLIDSIRRLQQQKRSGCLNALNGDETISYHLRDGFIQAVSSSDSKHSLGQLAAVDKLLRPLTVKRVVGRARRARKPLGEVLLERKYMRQATLFHLLRRQAYLLFRRCLDSNFRVGPLEPGSRTFRFPCRISLDSLLLELARDCSNAVKENAGRYVHLLRREDRDFDYVDWWPPELAILSLLRRQSLSIAELIENSGLTADEVKGVLGVLQMAGYVGFSSQKPLVVQPKNGARLEWIVPLTNLDFRNDKLELVKDRNSFVSEQFKSLKIHLMNNGEAAPQVIGVSSPFMGDGKSLVSSNLAVSFSQDPGRKVVLVDCDLRKPTLHDYLGVSAEPGITHYLTDSTLDPFCFLRRFGELYIMTVGRIAENPVELLSLKRMKALIDRLRKEFDTVILDCPPFEPISDARILSGLADGVVLVVRSGRTPYICGERAVKAVDSEKLLGVVLNDVKPMLFNTYYSYGYYYYGEKKGYPYAPGSKKAR